MLKEFILLEERARKEGLFVDVQPAGSNGVSVVVSKGSDRVVRLSSGENLRSAQMEAEIDALRAFFHIAEDHIENESIPTAQTDIGKAEGEARVKAEEEKKRIEAEKARAEAKAKAEEEVRAKAEEEKQRIEAEKAKAEAKAKAEEDARIKAEAEKARAEAAEKSEEEAKAEAEARAVAEKVRAEAEAKARAEAEAKARKKAQLEAELKALEESADTATSKDGDAESELAPDFRFAFGIANKWENNFFSHLILDQTIFAKTVLQVDPNASSTHPDLAENTRKAQAYCASRGITVGNIEKIAAYCKENNTEVTPDTIRKALAS